MSPAPEEEHLSQAPPERMNTVSIVLFVIFAAFFVGLVVELFRGYP